MADVVERLEHSIATAFNDDATAPSSEDRKRHVKRCEAMLDAVSELKALRAEVKRLTEANPSKKEMNDE